ncbi:MAG: response regulator [Sphingobacteriales bacterium]|nr:MAG: response regulator [Sphingobacteriales bacterium]
MAESAVILLIEDNPGDRQLIMQEFKALGHNIKFIIKEDGEEALQYLDEMSDRHKSHELPNLIILDLNLPRASGIEILQEYKKHPVFLTIPVIVFSSSSSATDIKSAYDNFANCYIPKPFAYEEFSEAVKSMWDFWFTITKLPRPVGAD